MIDTQGNTARKEEGDNPFEVNPMNAPPPIRINPRIYTVIASVLLLPFVLICAVTLIMFEDFFQLLPKSIYLRSLILNLPSAVAILFLPTKSIYKYIAVTAYWLILSPAVLMAVTIAAVTVAFAFGY